MEKSDFRLVVENVSKNYGDNIVLKDVNFKLKPGEILGLVGENGAGKSTLMNTLFGMKVIADTGGYKGDIYLNGEKIKFKSPSDAIKAGIGMVHQEFSLIPGFTVSENIMLNREFTKPNPISKVFGNRLDTLNVEKNDASSQKIIDLLGVKININDVASDMPVGYKQFIEIARELNRREVKLIIMDEPTAVLTESEAEILLKAIRIIGSKGISVIFISHRLREITSVCDKIVVLRDGMIIEDRENKDISINQIATWMVGRDIDKDIKVQKKDTSVDEEVIMEINNLWVDMPGETIHDVNLQIKKGEILGIGGLAGQGKLGIPNGIMGLYDAGGEVIFKGEKLDINNAKQMISKGISFVSEDRRGVGLLLEEPIYWNVTFNAMQVKNEFLTGGFLKIRDEEAMKKAAQKYVEELKIKCTSTEQDAGKLSGGNQQKVCLAKAFVMNPEILFVSEPTRGIDIGAKELVLDALKKFNKENGTTIVIISSELEELRSISDRIAIVCEGEIFGILPPDASPEQLGLLMSGEHLKEEECIQ